MVTNQAFEWGSRLTTLAQLNRFANPEFAEVDDYIVEERSDAMCFSPEDLLSHDSPINSHAIFDLSLQNPINGDVHWDGKQVIFIPDEGYRGPASFEYTVMDCQGYFDSAAVHLTV